MFIAEGNKIITELLDSEIVVKQIFAISDFFKHHRIDTKIERFEIKVSELERISSLATANEVLAVCEIPKFELDITSIKNKLTLVLDDIRDPGNLGTIIRIADWFGIENIICSNETVDAFNPKVVQATMGSISRIKIHTMDLIEFFKVESSQFKIQSFGAVLKGENIYTKELPAKGFIVIGNESKGISEQLLPFISDKISIPSFSHYKSN